MHVTSALHYTDLSCYGCNYVIGYCDLTDIYVMLCHSVTGWHIIGQFCKLYLSLKYVTFTFKASVDCCSFK